MLKRVMSNQSTEFGLPNGTGDDYVAALTIDTYQVMSFMPFQRLRALSHCTHTKACAT